MATAISFARDDGLVCGLQSLLGLLRHLGAKFTATCHFHSIEARKDSSNFSPFRFRTIHQMSNMLANGSSAHDESAMDVQETNTFQFSEEPSLEKM